MLAPLERELPHLHSRPYLQVSTSSGSKKVNDLLNTEHLEVLSRAVAAALLDCHIVRCRGSSGKSSTGYLLNTTVVGVLSDLLGSGSGDVGVLVELNSVGTTAERRRVAGASHLTLARAETHRGAVGELVCTVALSAVPT